jgi:hypothetical protein
MMKRNTLLAICLALPILAASVPAGALEVEVRVRTPPPILRVEAIPRAPGPGHYWIGGHWRWEHAAWGWSPGYWAEGRPGEVWVRAEWVRVGPEWVYRPGHWAPIVAPAAVVAVSTDVAPPPPQVEVVSAPPSADHFWVGGYWRWEGGRHVWTAGHWERSREGQYWVPSHWVRVDHHWQLHGGHWQPR